MKKDDCIFCKIAAGEIPSRKVYEDGEILAFHDIQPVAPVHFLMIPTAHVASLAECGPEHAAVLGRMMAMAGRLA
ncbi:MAG TPA: HIT domain-containing protein, partial [Usitatibacteraceae bacterium]|nr:HIT domain-containing protein [Usitatibacteraceae bacterium]